MPKPPWKMEIQRLREVDARMNLLQKADNFQLTLFHGGARGNHLLRKNRMHWKEGMSVFGSTKMAGLSQP